MTDTCTTQTFTYNQSFKDFAGTLFRIIFSDYLTDRFQCFLFTTGMAVQLNLINFDKITKFHRYTTSNCCLYILYSRANLSGRKEKKNFMGKNNV